MESTTIMNSVNSLDVFAQYDLDLSAATSATTTSSSGSINNKGSETCTLNADVSNVICEAEPSNDEILINHNNNTINIGESNNISSSPSSSTMSSPRNNNVLVLNNINTNNIPSPTSTSSPTSDGNTSPTISSQSTNNKKRTRATPEQLSILEDTFKTNTSPNSKVREALAEKVNMSERSIQIWFQNRRAKMKAMQKRAHLMINQESLNHFMTCMPPNYGPNLYPFRIPIHPQRIALPISAPGMRPQQNISNNQPQQQHFAAPLQQFTPPQEFLSPSAYQSNVALMPCETLTIGTWRRILTIQEPKDLLCYYTLPQNIITYHITNENTHFKMEFPFLDITAIEYRPIDENTSQLAIEVKDTPKFYMETPQGRWNMCKDFTEDRQASRHTRHVIKGRSAFMKPALIKLMQDDSDLSKVVSILDSPSSSSYPSPSSISDNQINNNNNNNNNNSNNNIENKSNILLEIQQQEQQNNDQPSRRSSYPIPGNNNNNNNNNNNSFINGNSNGNSNDNGLCINLSNSNNELLQNIHRIRRSASVPPLTPNSDIFNGYSSSPLSSALALSSLSSSPLSLSPPIDVFDSSPTLIQSSPLLNQLPFVGEFQSSHNLSNLHMDSDTSTILSDEQIAASMISFNDDTSFISSMNLDDASWLGGDVASFLLEC